MTQATFFWHDYETFGADPQRDRPCQFAGIRTDLDFNIVAPPLEIYCKPSNDYLPAPEACLITGITPQIALQRGVCEAEFARAIHEQLALPGTCALGYNTIRFDDEVTRNLLYRNFYDAYAREWQNQNSRWDLIDTVRATRALRPDGIVWPNREDGTPSFRLQDLTAANDIGHEHAHDALADVYATINLAKLIKQRQPKLFQYLISHRSKSAAQDLLKLGSFTPLVHVSGRFAARNNCLAIILPLAAHPRNANEVITYDLSIAPQPLLDLTADEIKARLFTTSDNLPEGMARIPLKTIHINKCPVLAPLSVIRPEDVSRLQIDLPLCNKHLMQIKAAVSLQSKLAIVFEREYPPSSSDPDLMLYSGGFFSADDKATMNRLRQLNAEQLRDIQPNFLDARLQEMWLRYKARNYPRTLSPEEQDHWQRHRLGRLVHPGVDGFLSLIQFREKISEIREDAKANQHILDDLDIFASDIEQSLTK